MSVSFRDDHSKHRKLANQQISSPLSHRFSESSLAAIAFPNRLLPPSPCAGLPTTTQSSTMLLSG